MTNCGIYGLKNTSNGKWYIGQSVNIGKRRGIHLWALRAGRHSNEHLQRAFKRHGWESFEFHILEEVAETMLDTRERAWIAYYKSNQLEFGYNKESGGSLNKRATDETKLKISQSNMGRKITAETIQKRLLSRKNGAGFKHSEESRRKISLVQIGKKKAPWTAARRLAASIAATGRRNSAEANLKNALAHTGKVVSEATRQKLRVINQNRPPITDETRRKISEGLRGRKLSEETRKKLSAITTEQWRVKRAGGSVAMVESGATVEPSRN